MKREGTAEAALEKLQNLYQAFKFMEQRLTQKKAKLKVKLPEIQKTYNALTQMEEQAKLGEALVTHYELAQSIFAKAKVNVHENDKVCLWLGANVMLEYSYDEALEMLNRNLAGANQKLANCTEDLQFLRDQIITSEVNMARVFNYDVRRRRVLRDAALGVDGAGGEEEGKGGEAESKD